MALDTGPAGSSSFGPKSSPAPPSRPALAQRPPPYDEPPTTRPGTRAAELGQDRKLADLKRDPRLAMHSPSVDPPDDDPGAWVGEAKISGRAAPTDAGFRVDITEVAFTYLVGGLVIESWHPGRGHVKRVRD